MLVTRLHRLPYNSEGNNPDKRIECQSITACFKMFSVLSLWDATPNIMDAWALPTIFVSIVQSFGTFQFSHANVRRWSCSFRRRFTIFGFIP
jgi:hypothetical protein